MKLSRIVKKKEFEMTVAPDKWKKLWQLWADGSAASPCRELMTYITEVNNGGHAQYFSHLADNGVLAEELPVLKSLMGVKHRINLWLAYKAYRSIEKKESAVAEMLLMLSDIVFDVDEAVFNQIVEQYAAKLDE